MMFLYIVFSNQHLSNQQLKIQWTYNTIEYSKYIKIVKEQLKSGETD
jgi:hypothetical protein